MAIKWKKNLNSAIVLQSLEKAKHTNKDGVVAFSGYEYILATSALHSMIEFPDFALELNVDGLLREAITNVANKGMLSNDSLIAEINELAQHQHAQPEREYIILSSLSLASPLPLVESVVDGCKLNFIGSIFPENEDGRSKVFKDNPTLKDTTPESYQKISIHVKSKYFESAVTKALDAVDLYRAIWSLFCNPHSEVAIFEDSNPINVIRLGEVHTLHHKSGELFDGMYWYEPNFVPTKPYVHSSIDKSNKNYEYLLERVLKSPFNKKLKRALLRYVRACDERDHNVAIIRLWGALEELLLKDKQAKYDLVTRRCAFLFGDYELAFQVMEHIREYRNLNVHQGHHRKQAKLIAYQIQYFFFELIKFYIKNDSLFNSLDEANELLDMPPNIDELHRIKSQIEAAIKYVSGSEN